MQCANCGAQLTSDGPCAVCGTVPGHAAPTQAARDPWAAPSEGHVPPPPPAPGMGGPSGPVPGAPGPAGGFSQPGGPVGYPAPPAAPWGGAYGYTPPMEWVAVKPLRGLATAVSILLGVTALTDLVQSIAFFRRAAMYDDLLISASLEDADDADDFVQIGLTFWGLAFLATAVVFIIWFHRARSNSEAWQGPQATMSKGWAIGGWFIPLANFVIPQIVANDIWNRSDARAATPGGQATGKGLMWGWWLTFAGAGLLLGISTAVRETEEDFEDGKVSLEDYVDSYELGDSLAGTSSLIRIAAAVLAILVVQRITAMQEQRMGIAAQPTGYAGGMPPMMGAQGYGPPPPGMAPPYGSAPQPPHPGAPGQPGWGGHGADTPPPSPGGIDWNKHPNGS